jgi:predicted metal-binding integral membrane protein DUF2182
MTSTSEAFGRRATAGRVGLAVLPLALAVLAWISTGDRMQGMDAGPGTDLGGVGWFAGVWVVMMAAMMLPSIVPVVLMHPRIRMDAHFIAGYPVSWAAAGLLGYAVFEAVGSLELGFLAWDRGRTRRGGRRPPRRGAL